jgi:micrococcal nuclease
MIKLKVAVRKYKMRKILPLLLVTVIFTFSAALSSWAEENTWDFLTLGGGKYQKIKVKKVISADTLILENDEKIKLIGLKAPEAPKRKIEKEERDQYGFVIEKEVDPATPLQEQAMEFVENLLLQKEVRLEFDLQKKNEKFLTFAYVFLVEGDVFVNEEIIRQGYANLQIQPPNTKYVEKLRDAYRQARQERRGLQSE